MSATSDRLTDDSTESIQRQSSDKCTKSGDTFIHLVSNLVEDNHVMTINDSQINMLSRFEKTNEMLVNCNALAVIRFESANRDLKRYTQQLVDLQKDLDSVFHRIKFLKLKLTQQYSQAFKDCGNVFNPFNEEEEEINEDLKDLSIN
ncbi:kxDL motif-containing protein CG10681-like [Oppia nitens]|uniref:kxDL motif-containing protein CG10681-like n=1 Tax=Oppia nitens TaxID=1686743 RepID=UPI0023DB64EF|nr:kxDL motif-containing protein CG10681-like [Oppia nitens]